MSGDAGVEDYAQACQGTFGLSKFRRIDELYFVVNSFQPLHRFWETGLDEKRLLDPEDIRSGSLVARSRNQVEPVKVIDIYPIAIHQKSVIIYCSTCRL